MGALLKYGYALLPTLGISIFLGLYIVAAFLYPGGTKNDKTTIGFSLLHNYWCDLLDKNAYNGAPNPGSIVAIVATILLCCSVGYLCYLLPVRLQLQQPIYSTIQVFGIGSMFIFLFIFTPLHNAVITVGTPLGGVAILAIVVALYQVQAWPLVYVAALCFVLCIANYSIYQTGYGLHTLPLLQKITFVFFSVWMVMVNLFLVKV